MHNHSKQSYRVHIRAVQPSDIKPLARMVQEAWHTDDNLDAFAQAQLGMLDAVGCMFRSTQILVATLIDNKTGQEQIAGCAAVVDRRHPEHKPYRALFARHAVRALCALAKQPAYVVRNGKQVAELLQYQHNDHRMLRQAQREHMGYQGELALFIVDQRLRGFGLGKRLWQAAMQWFDRRQIARFFLFTDSTCDWQYYEHIGLTRRVTLPTRIPAQVEHEHNPDRAVFAQTDTGMMTMMLYDGLVHANKPMGNTVSNMD